jgi:hypothetical protein
MWPGRARSSGRVSGCKSVFTVVARSRAEIPVLTLCLASTEIAKAVSKAEVFSDTMAGIWSWSRRALMMGRQIRPRPWVAMKLIASGVTFSAAMVRSPSFSRSSSSTTITILPCWMSRMASSILAKGAEGSLAGRGSVRRGALMRNRTPSASPG